MSLGFSCFFLTKRSRLSKAREGQRVPEAVMAACLTGLLLCLTPQPWLPTVPYLTLPR